jgi:hypothetical protein
MNLTMPRYSSPIVLLIGVLAIVFPGIAICSSLCPTDDPGIEIFQSKICLFNSHSFIPWEVQLSALFTLPLIGAFIAAKIFSLPAGYFFPLYKPPRFPF